MYELMEHTGAVSSMDKNPCYSIPSRFQPKNPSASVISRKVETKSKKPVWSWVCIGLLVRFVLIGNAAFISITIRYGKALQQLQAEHHTGNSKIDVLLTTIRQNSINPAASCSQISLLNPSSPSGHYWIRFPNRSIVRVCCDFDRQCGCVGPVSLDLTKYNPARSCRELAACNSSLSDGYYWIRTQGSSVRVYCNSSNLY